MSQRGLVKFSQGIYPTIMIVLVSLGRSMDNTFFRHSIATSGPSVQLTTILLPAGGSDSDSKVEESTSI